MVHSTATEAEIFEDVVVLVLVEEAEIIKVMIIIRMIAMKIKIPGFNKEEEVVVLKEVEDEDILSVGIVINLDIEIQTAGTNKEMTRKMKQALSIKAKMKKLCCLLLMEKRLMKCGTLTAVLTSI